MSNESKQLNNLVPNNTGIKGTDVFFVADSLKLFAALIDITSFDIASFDMANW